MERWDLLEVVFEFPSISLNSIDEYQNNALHYASLQGNTAMLDKLLNMQINLLQKNFQGDEPLHTCVYTDMVDCFVSILNKCGRPEAHEEFITNKKNNKNENCFTMSILQRAFKIFTYCLSTMKKLEYLDEMQMYPIHYIIDANNYEFLESFLEKKPNLKILNNQKETPLFYCLRQNKTSFFKVDLYYQKLLYYYEEDYLSHKNKEGQTVLHLAAIYNNLTAARLLMEYNLDVNDPDSKGKTPLDYAKEYPDIYEIMTADL